MKAKGTKNISFTQRLQLEAYLRAGLHKKTIASKLGLCLATVYNEIQRGAYEHTNSDLTTEMRYSPNLAEDKYRVNQTSKGAPIKLGKDHDFAKYIERRVLRDKLSPCAVLGEIKRRQLFSTDISKPTLYRYIEMGYIGGLSMQDLPMGKRKKRYRRAVAKRPPKGTSIEKRPQEVASRQTFGHWEMDTLCGSTRATFLVLSERLTRNEFILPMPNLKAESVIRCLNILERRFGRRFRNVFKSITIDNGSEFSDFHGLEKSIYRGKRTSVFYCHPYCSSERGTNERLNREIRRHIPKGSDLSKYSAEDIKSVENWVNNYPREIFGYATSQELFEQHLRAVF